ncbi:hypothetical protein [Natronospora cellulosivora (SeqCode)]
MSSRKFIVNMINNIYLNYSEKVLIDIKKTAISIDQVCCMIIAIDFIFNKPSLLKFKYIIDIKYTHLMGNDIATYKNTAIIFLPDNSREDKNFNLPAINNIDCSFDKIIIEKDKIKGIFSVKFETDFLRRRAITLNLASRY